jgi:RNA polymerase sigma-70 factor (ECF subfamily)
VLHADHTESERLLIERVRHGDAEAFGELVSRYLQRAMAVAFRVVHHREDAEDLVQDAFLSALRHLDDFDAARPFWPWLSRIIVNRGLDLRSSRAVRTVVGLDEDVEDPSKDSAAEAERDDLRAQFRRALEHLPPRRRLVIELFEVEELSIAEIADALHAAPATIRWHLHAARRQLRGALEHFHGETI